MALAAQLAKVPRMRRPSGSAAVRSSAWPAAGPATTIGVFAVMRRARREGRTTDHGASVPLPSRCTSITDTPCAACERATCSAVRAPPASEAASRCSSRSSVYSWFSASRP